MLSSLIKVNLDIFKNPSIERFSFNWKCLLIFRQGIKNKHKLKMDQFRIVLYYHNPWVNIHFKEVGLTNYKWLTLGQSEAPVRRCYFRHFSKPTVRPSRVLPTVNFSILRFSLVYYTATWIMEKKGLRQCAKLQDSGEGHYHHFYCCDY